MAAGSESRGREGQGRGSGSALSDELWRDFIAAADATPPAEIRMRGTLWFQPEVRAVYDHKWLQFSIAALIFANFFANILEAQLDPFGKDYPEIFLTIEDVFNYIFLVELMVNAYAHWLRPFLRSGWNWFDILVVAVGLLSIARIELPGPFALLRMLRAFRVFRLFKRIRSLQRVIIALLSAVPGMLNAAFINVCLIATDSQGKEANRQCESWFEHKWLASQMRRTGRLPALSSSLGLHRDRVRLLVQP